MKEGFYLVVGDNTSCYTWLWMEGAYRMEDINKRVGKRIRALRLNKGISQEGLADKSGLQRSHMGEIERGELNVTLKTLERIGLALKMSLIELLGEAGGRRRKLAERKISIRRSLLK